MLVNFVNYYFYNNMQQRNVGVWEEFRFHTRSKNLFVSQNAVHGVLRFVQEFLEGLKSLDSVVALTKLLLSQPRHLTRIVLQLRMIIEKNKTKKQVKIKT